MIQVTKIIENLKSEIEVLKKEVEKVNLCAQISPLDFKLIFLLEAQKEMLKKGLNKEFIIDDENKEIINQLFYYLTLSDKFSGDFNKGILLAGSIGSGKTLIISTFCNVFEKLNRKSITRTHSKRINDLIKCNESGYYDKRPMFIDDLGRESKEVNNYGTKELPIIDLLSIRYDYGTLTFATTNFNEEKLKDFYGEAVADRFKEMFNTLLLLGKSKRA
jgi:DNA replication protein DnaC